MDKEKILNRFKKVFYEDSPMSTGTAIEYYYLRFALWNNTSTKNENGNDANRLLSPAFLQSLDWWQLYKVAEPLVAKISVEKLHEKLLEIYPLEKSQEYVGSLCNHYRGRLKHEGKFALIDQMCSNSMRRLIIGLSS